VVAAAVPSIFLKEFEMDKKGNLVLHRKEGESLSIGEAVVTVLKARNGNVRLMIKAPKHVSILRDDANKKEKAQ
jgi:carbon storage regulator CsrA